MSIAELAQRSYYDDTGTSNSYTTIIIIVVVVFILKICLISFFCYLRNKKQNERRIKGCTCFNDTDYFCTPWWYWSSDRRCHCGALQNSMYNAPPHQPSQLPAYSSDPAYPAAGYNASPVYSSPPGYPAATYSSGPQTEARQWNSRQESVPLKPAQQVQANGQYY